MILFSSVLIMDESLVRQLVKEEVNNAMKRTRAEQSEGSSSTILVVVLTMATASSNIKYTSKASVIVLGFLLSLPFICNIVSENSRNSLQLSSKQAQNRGSSNSIISAMSTSFLQVVVLYSCGTKYNESGRPRGKVEF